MMMSQRFPDYFDGILACSPGFKLPKAAVTEAWDTQAFAEVAKSEGIKDSLGQPFMNKTFTDEDFALLDTPLFPFSIITLLWAFGPICRTYPHKEWFVRPSFTYSIEKTQWESHPV